MHFFRISIFFCWMIALIMLQLVCIPLLFADTNEVYLPSSIDSIDTPIDSILIKGISRPHIDSLRLGLLSSEGSHFNRGYIHHDYTFIQNYLNHNGWLDASVQVHIDTTDSINTIIYDLIPGNRIYIKNISIEIHTEENRLPQITTPAISGKPFTKQSINDAISSIIKTLLSSGYPYSEIIPIVSANGDSVDIVLSIFPGNPASVDSVVVGGLTKTKPEVILRELNRIKGREANQSTLLQAFVILQRLTFINANTRPYFTYTSDGKCVLNAVLEERGTGSFEGVAGYQPKKQSAGNNEFIGKTNLSLYNIMGTGRSSKIRWENLGGGKEDLELRYYEPRIPYLPLSLDGMFLQEERKISDYTLTRFKLKLGYYWGYLTLNGGYRFDKTSADSITSSEAHGIESGIGWNAVDNLLNPQSGYHYQAVWSFMQKDYVFQHNLSTELERTEIDIHHYIPTVSMQTLALLLHYRRVITDVGYLEPADKYWLGGSTTIRGYRERFFPASEALYGSVEYRFLTGGASRFFLFVDSGHMKDYRSSDTVLSQYTTTKTGYGFGIRIQSTAGTLGFDYGLGIGDTPGEGKIHVRLVTEF